LQQIDGMTRSSVGAAAPPGTITLTDRKAAAHPTAVCGAVLVQAYSSPTPAAGKPSNNEIAVPLRVFPEPKLVWQRVVGINVEKALDEHGQDLSAVLVKETPAVPDGAETIMINGANGVVIRRVINANGQLIMEESINGSPTGVANQTVLKLKPGAEPSTKLKELQGVMTAQIRTPTESLVAVDNVMQAPTDLKTGKGDCSLKVSSANQNDDGTYTLNVECRYNSGLVAPATDAMIPPKLLVPGGGPLIANPSEVPRVGNGPNIITMTTAYCGIVLTDADGKAFRFVRCTNSRATVSNGLYTRTMTVIFRPAADDQGEPAKMAFYGSQTETVDIPFSLKDVPLAAKK
jgi:hypothetical protein